MVIKPRSNSTPDNEVDALIEKMKLKLWQNVGFRWDDGLKVWRAQGTWKGQKREGRGSTPLHALSSLNDLTPPNV